MPKKSNPLFKATQPAEPEVLDDDDRAALIEMPLPGDTPLTKKEAKRLKELEDIVHKALSEAMFKAWYAMREIQQVRLYRKTHATFEEYAKERWDMARQTAYQYIAAADVIDNVRNCGQKLIPQNEAQARVLTKYSPEKQTEIWTVAVSSAENGKITAAHIRQTARRLYNEKVQKTVKKAKKKTAKAPKMSDAFRTALMALYEQIDAEREADWAHTSREEVARQLRGLVEVVEAEL